jgi:solute carrier family 50 protein (sugar transporter)
MIKCEDNRTCVVLTSYVVPSLGIVTANLLWFSSLPRMIKVLEESSLGTINPIPFPFMLLNSFVWVLYAILTQDHLAFFSVIFGFVISVYYCGICIFSAMSEFDRTKNIKLGRIINRMKILISFAGVVFIFSLYVFLIMPIDLETKQNICGIMALSFLAMFYASPLSVIFNVIKKKDSSGLELYFVLAALLNSALWAIYGLFMNDIYMWTPSAFGVLVSLLQLSCIRAFPRNNLDVDTNFHEENSVHERLLAVKVP